MIATPFSNVDPESEAWRDTAAQQSTALVLGSFNSERQFSYANVGMRRLLKLDDGPFDAASFRSPSFSSFFSHAPSKKPVYSGLITIQVGQDAGVSIRATVFRTDNSIHVIGEYDVMEMAAVNEQMHELNREVTRLHRESARKTRELQRALRQLQESQAAREKLQSELLDASRRAGRAEVAVGVLHNVGNALNSVAVSAALVAETVQAGQLNALEKVVHTLQQHQDDLPAFMASTQGRRMLPYLQALSVRMLDERQRLLNESGQIDARLATLKSLVDEHQKYGRQTTVNEVVDLVPLVDERWPLVTRPSEPDLQGVNLIEVVQAAFRRLHAPPGVQFKLETSTDPFYLDFDPAQCRQVFDNLLSNARHAVKEEGWIEVLLESTGRHAEVRVRDSGPGVPAELRENVFDSLFTTKAKGTGLGLAICRQLVERHKGTIELEPGKDGAGSSFLIRIPKQS